MYTIVRIADMICFFWYATIDRHCGNAAVSVADGEELKNTHLFLPSNRHYSIAAQMPVNGRPEASFRWLF